MVLLKAKVVLLVFTGEEVVPVNYALFLIGKSLSFKWAFYLAMVEKTSSRLLPPGLALSFAKIIERSETKVSLLVVPSNCFKWFYSLSPYKFINFFFLTDLLLAALLKFRAVWMSGICAFPIIESPKFEILACSIVLLLVLRDYYDFESILMWPCEKSKFSEKLLLINLPKPSLSLAYGTKLSLTM